MTHFITIYISLLIPIYLYMTDKNIITTISKSIKIIIPSLLPVSIWLIRNMTIHGISLHGALGAYSCFFHRLFIYPDMIPAKLFSLVNITHYNTRMLFTISMFILLLFTK